jgi:hypothetical protein
MAFLKPTLFLSLFPSKREHYETIAEQKLWRNHQVPLCWCIISLHCLQPWIVSQPFETKGHHAPPLLSKNSTRKSFSQGFNHLGYLLPLHPVLFFQKQTRVVSTNSLQDEPGLAQLSSNLRKGYMVLLNEIQFCLHFTGTSTGDHMFSPKICSCVDLPTNSGGEASLHRA